MKRDALHQQIIEILPRLRKFAYSLTGAKADADDLLQTTVERLLQRTMPKDVELIKWAFRVCKNIWIDELRSKNVRIKAVAVLEVEASNNVDGEKTVMAKMALQEVNQAMSQLPNEQRAAMALVCVEGYSYAEAAAALDLPIGTIMSRISRARVTLNAFFNSDSKANQPIDDKAGNES